MKQALQYWLRAIASISCTLTVTSLFALWVEPGNSRELEDIFSGRDIPLTLPLSELDSSWQKLRMVGTHYVEFQEQVSKLFGNSPHASSFLNSFSNIFVYYTQGEVVQLHSNTYLIAYHVSNQFDALNLLWFPDSCEEFFPQPFSPQESVKLTLLNLNRVEMERDTIPLDSHQEILNSIQRYDEALALCRELSNQSQKI